MPPIFPPPQAAAPAPAFTASLSVSMDFAYMRICFLPNLFQYPLSSICQSVPFIYASGPVLFISLLCLLDSTYEVI